MGKLKEKIAAKAVVPKPEFTEAELMYLNRAMNWYGHGRFGIDLDVSIAAGGKLSNYVKKVRVRQIGQLELKPAGQTNGEAEDRKPDSRVPEAAV